jgi:Polyketide cyclase / dehydrase and lipid transport
MLYAIIILAIVIAAFLIMGLTTPANFSVVRETDFNATPAKVFAQINDFHHWAAWSPWEKMDPNLVRNFSGETSGAGAKYSWVGNKKVGEGSMEITHSVPSTNMQLDLHFLKPFKADNVTEFTLSPSGKGTHFKWEMRGQTPFMLRVMKLFFNMDKIVGKDFENGLANLKAIVEK